MYNAGIYPYDHVAKRYIDQKVELVSGTKTEDYLDQLDKALKVAESRFQPQLIVYNAGTDILDGDPLGRLKVTFGTIHISQKKCLLKQSNMFPTKSGFCSSNSWVSYLSCEQDK
jgi:acetoin utilization deacetylase AcuC-like enzyme